jgi:hypothetical protein
MSIYDKLEEMGVTLPKMTPPVAAYVPWVVADQLLYLSGHIAKRSTLGRAAGGGAHDRGGSAGSPQCRHRPAGHHSRGDG